MNCNYFVLKRYLLLWARNVGIRDKSCAILLLNILRIMVFHKPECVYLIIFSARMHRCHIHIC